MSSDWTYGEAADVYERLMSDADVGIGEVHAALCNAMRRIAALERHVAQVEQATMQAANVASCLANGIVPD